MAIIKSISGIRGTIGGKPGENLTPQDIVASVSAYACLLKEKSEKPLVIVGRDARISGEIVSSLVTSTLQAMGADVIDLGLSTTPTVEMAVPMESASGAVIITASHNPREWNALKLINENGEFISAEDGRKLLDYIEKGNIEYAEVGKLGTYRKDDSYIQKHIDQIFALDLVDVEKIKEKNFTVVVDCINSTGAISVIPMLEQLNCKVIPLFDDLSGNFAHNPEPLPDHLYELSKAVTKNRADLGIAVDPDVDRLAFVCEDGEMFGEEYTLVAVADYILKHKPGNTVSNLSSTQALKDVTLKYQGQYFASAVGEVNVVTKMKEVNAVIGGEGNGGVIFPELHYGRDALVGIALMLSHLEATKFPISFMRQSYPSYTISKNKIQLTEDINLDLLFDKLKEKYQHEKQDTTDGLKIEFDNEWIHLRRSNTEPIVRIYTESTSPVIAEQLANKIKSDINEILKAVAV